jgi:hypothetical protein
MPAKKTSEPKKTGRAKQALQVKGVAINDDFGLEREADAVGARAAGTARQWRVSVIKKKLEYIGRVQAADKASAAMVAAVEFGLKDHERTRLVIDEVV